MHIVVVADGRSPHTVGWVRGMAELGLRTTLLSSHILSDESRERLEAVLDPSAIHQPDDAWSRMRPTLTFASPNRRPHRLTTSTGNAGRVTPRGAALGLLEGIELWASGRLTTRLARLIETERPDAVHALRIQFEAIAATECRTGLPIAVSTWGSDLVSSARASNRMAQLTSRVLRRADLVICDCERDAALAQSWGLRSGAAQFVIPGNFGVNIAKFPDQDPDLATRLGLEDRPLVVYPRGIRAAVNGRGFLAAARLLASESVNASFVAVGLFDGRGAQADVPGRIVSTAPLDPATMLTLAASSAVTVSPSFSDGMPNSVLEGMAGGAIPVCGVLESLRELERKGAVIAWCDPGEPMSIASAITSALELAKNHEHGLRNRRVVVDHYSTSISVPRAREAYEQLVRAR